MNQFRWPAVDANRYRIWLTVGQTLVWETSAMGTNVTYTGPTLAPRTRYRWVVVPDDIAPEALYALDFQLVTPFQQASIQAKIAEIEQRDGSELAIALMKADYYLSLGDAGEPAA